MRCWGQWECLTWCSVFQEGLAASPILGSWGAHPKDRLCQPGGSRLGSCPRRGSGKMSGGTAHLLMALFVAAAMGYQSRRSATDLDATPRTTVTFDGKGVQVLVVRFGILPAPGLVRRDLCPAFASPWSWELRIGGVATGRPPVPWAPEIRACMSVWCWVPGVDVPRGMEQDKGISPKVGGDKSMQGAFASPQPCRAALGWCPELGITPRLGSQGPDSQQGAFFHDFL